MRCHYMSDLHLESQAFEAKLPAGDVLIVAGDLCHARALDPAKTDKFGVDQRDRALRFIDQAVANFEHVLLIPGNHEHYDGVFEETAGIMRLRLPAVTVLENETIEIGGVRFFGSTLWSDFGGGCAKTMNDVRRRMGEYFFVKTRRDSGLLGKFQPEDALAAHTIGWAALKRAVDEHHDTPLVVITHHAPSLQGLNPKFRGNEVDAAYASHLDNEIANFVRPVVWVHGHTHIAGQYRIGETVVRSNALGFASKGQGARSFSTSAHFEI